MVGIEFVRNGASKLTKKEYSKSNLYKIAVCASLFIIFLGRCQDFAFKSMAECFLRGVALRGAGLENKKGSV